MFNGCHPTAPTSVSAMEIVLIRHAQPAWSHEGLAVTNPGLTPLGLRQANRLIGPAQEWRQDGSGGDSLIMASTMARSRQTAIPVGAGANLRVVHHPWLEEIRPPDHWHGQPTEYIDDLFSGALTRPPEQWWDGFDGGESFRDFHQRVTGGFLAAAAHVGLTRSDLHEQLWELPESGPDRLVLVAHGGTNAVLLGLLLGLETVPWEWERFFFTHASITRIAATPIGSAHTFSLRRFSDTAHLGVDEVTA